MVSGPRILVVDDERANLQLLRRLLSGAGYAEVTATTDPTEVEGLVQANTPDLVLLDLHMPLMDGYEVMSRLSALVDDHDFLPVLVLTADATPEAKQRALHGGATDFLTKPFDRAEVLARVANLLRSRSLHRQLREHNELLEEKVRQRTADLWRTVGDLERAQRDLRVAQEETIHSLSLAAELRDDETSRHIERMSRYCALLARSSGHDEHDADVIRLAAKMHDIGKIGIPDGIVGKLGRLTPEEFETMKAHAQIGHDILSAATSSLAATASEIAWTHHEWWDGGGYPRGLSQETIPLVGRIAAVADVFDALTTNRVYRKAFELPDALNVMRRGRGTQFDPAVVDLLFEELPQILETKQTLDEPRFVLLGRRGKE